MNMVSVLYKFEKSVFYHSLFVEYLLTSQCPRWLRYKGEKKKVELSLKGEIYNVLQGQHEGK